MIKKLRKITPKVDHLSIICAEGEGSLRNHMEMPSQIISAAEHSIASMSLREPDLSKCLVSRIVNAAIRLKNAPHNSIEKYTV